MHFVYIVQCRDSTLYTGTAKDVKFRIDQHNSGKGARYTKGRGPVKLLYYERYETVGDALRREREIKKWPRARKWALMNDPLPDRSLKKNPQV